MEVSKRRHGDALLAAIYQAVIAELAEVGYAGLSMSKVAERAQTGKATLYRRWKTKSDLVLATIHDGLPIGEHPAATGGGSVRDIFLALLTRMAASLRTPLGGAIRAILTETHQEPQLIAALRKQVFEPRGRMLREMLRRGVADGQIRAAVLDGDVADIGHELVMFRFVVDGEVTEDYIRHVVDDIMMPLLRPATAHEEQLRAEIDELKIALAEAHLELRRSAG